MYIDAPILRQSLPHEDEAFAEVFQEFRRFDLVAVARCPVLGLEVGLGGKGEIVVEEFDLSLDLVFDQGVLVQEDRLEELEVVPLDDQVPPAVFRRFAKGAQNLEGRRLAQEGRPGEDHPFLPLSGIFQGRDADAVQGLEIELAPGGGSVPSFTASQSFVNSSSVRLMIGIKIPLKIILDNERGSATLAPRLR